VKKALDTLGPVWEKETRQRSFSRRITVCKLCIFIGMTLFGWVGWWLGAKVGFMTAFLVSSLGSMVGVYVGWRIHRDFLD